MSTIASCYRVDHIEVDPSHNCLRRDGEEYILRNQTFHVLLYLLERAGKLVSKEELTAEIWRDSAVTENALTQCIAEIRKALGDDHRHPTYIKTISKAGYQFVAPVEAIGSDSMPSAMASRSHATPYETLAAAAAPPSIPAPPATANPPQSFFTRKRAMLYLALAAVASLVLLIWIAARARRTPAPLSSQAASRSLAIMYFENESGNRDYDWLRQGLADMMITDMSRSGELHVLSRQQLSMLVDDSRKSAQAPEDQAMHIAYAAHAANFLTGSFAAIAGSFRIDIQLHDSRDGQILFADHIVFQDSSEILDQVDVLAAHLASAMSLNPAMHPNIAESTTKNVEAYQYYSLGVEKAHDFENAQAIDLLKQAIELDPGFAMAYARIGYTYALSDFTPEQGIPYLEKASQLSGNLPEKDRLYIKSWYSIAKGDYSEAERTLNRITAMYPQETEAYWHLAGLLRAEERPEEGVAILQKGLALNPDDKNLDNSLGFVLLSLHRYPEAIAAEQRYVELAPDEPNSHDSLGMAYQQSGNYPSALTEYSKALALNPQFEPSIIHMGDAYYQTQHYEKAIAQYRRYIDVVHTDAARALGYGDLATVYLAMNHMPEAEQAAALELKNNPNAVWNSLVIALKKSDSKTESRLEQILLKNIPTQERGAPGDQRTRHYYLGYIDLRKGKAREALQEFRISLQHLPSSSGMDTYESCLADAELQLGDYRQAIAEYNRILKLNPNYPLAHENLTRAQSSLEQQNLAQQRQTADSITR